MAKPNSGGGRFHWGFILPILALGLLIYSQCLFFDFSYCDDYKIIVEQHHEIESFSKLPSAFTESYGNLYRPH